MSELKMLKSLIKSRLDAAAEDIFELFEEIMKNYEEQLSKSTDMKRQHTQQLLEVKKDVPRLWHSTPLPLQEEFKIRHEGKQTYGLEEASITDIKIEDDEEKPPHQLFQSKTEENRREEVPASCTAPEHGHLEKQLIVNTGEKPFGCDICEKRFDRQSYLKKHVKTHAEETPFGCDMCGSRFKLQRYLKKHMRVHKKEELLGYNVRENKV